MLLTDRSSQRLAVAMISSQYVYEVRPRKDHGGFNLISNLLPFARLCYGQPNAIGCAMGYAKLYSRSHDAVIRVYDDTRNVIEMHEHNGDFKECLLFDNGFS